MQGREVVRFTTPVLKQNCSFWFEIRSPAAFEAGLIGLSVIKDSFCRIAADQDHTPPEAYAALTIGFFFRLSWRIIA